MNISDTLAAVGLIPVVKLNCAQDAVPLCGALLKGGLPAAEITFRTDAAEEAIRLAVQAYPDMAIGAGTVTSIAQADAALSAGAKYIVTPGLNPKVVSHCIENGYPVFPGCPTTSDIEIAREMGLCVVKFFPASAMGGAAAIKAVSAPYPEMRFIPTGGINAANVQEYMSLPKVVACGGSWMVPETAINAQDWDMITSLTAKAVNAVHGFAIHHVAFNCGSAEKGEETAAFFSRLFGWEHIREVAADHAGTWIEAMKINAKGTIGHIAVAVNSIPRAKAYMQLKGIAFDEQTQKQVCWLREEIMGFGVQIVDPKLM